MQLAPVLRPHLAEAKVELGRLVEDKAEGADEVGQALEGGDAARREGHALARAVAADEGLGLGLAWERLREVGGCWGMFEC